MFYKFKKVIVAFALSYIAIYSMFFFDRRLFQSSPNMILNIAEPNDPVSSITSGRHPFTVAYAFYVTDYHYSCFTLINVYRLLNVLLIDDSVKIVLLVKKVYR